MKVKSRKLAKRRAKNSKNAWYKIRPMSLGEAQRAQYAITSVLTRHADGLYYGDAPSPEEAILRKLDRRSAFGDRTRQLLIFQSVLNEMKKLGAIAYDPLRKRVGYNVRTLVQ